MSIFSSHLPSFFRDFGQVAIWGAYVTRGLLDFHGMAYGPDGVVQVGGTEVVFTFPTADLPGIHAGDSISIGGTAYLLNTEPRNLGDALISYAHLEVRP